MRISLATLVGLSLVAACSSGPSEGGDAALPADAGSTDAGSALPDARVSDAGVQTSSCALVRVEDLAFAFLDDVSIRYIGDIRPNLGSPGPDLFVFDTLHRLDFPTSTGTFSLGTGFNSNFGGCTHCPLVFEDFVDGVPPQRVYFPSAGQLELARDPFSYVLSGSVRGLHMVEVTIDGPTLESVPVPGGRCLDFEDFTLSYRFVPPEWTCDPAKFNDGLECDCACGVSDFDCIPGVASTVGCGAGQVCLYDVCVDTCSALEPLVPCAAGFCSFSEWGDVCSADRALVDSAQLGQRCVGDDTSYCALQNSIPRGYCDRVAKADSICKKTCAQDSECSAANRESCIGVGSGRGFCEQRFPAGWTCQGDQWEEGQACDCNCGVPDTIDCQSNLPVRGCAAGEGCSLGGACVPRPSNDRCEGALRLSGARSSTVGTTIGAADDLAVGPGEGLCLEGSQLGPDVVYALELTRGARISAVLRPMFDGALYLLGPGGCALPAMSCLAGSDAVRAGMAETLSATVAAAGTYYLVVDSFWTQEQGTFELDVQLQ